MWYGLRTMWSQMFSYLYFIFLWSLHLSLVSLSIYLLVQYVLNDVSVLDSVFQVLYVELIGSWHGQELQAQVVIADKTFPSIFIAPFISVFLLEHDLLSYT